MEQWFKKWQGTATIGMFASIAVLQVQMLQLKAGVSQIRSNELELVRNAEYKKDITRRMNKVEALLKI